MKPRFVVAGLSLLLVAGCTFPSVTPPPSVPPVSQGPVTGIPISDTPGVAVDRPTLPANQAQPEGFRPAPGKDLAAYLAQSVAWSVCEGGECAQLAVPLDYADPGAQAITLSLKRAKATGQRKGSLFVNPGGPGASGTSLVDSFVTAGLEDYDIVGWDPRGTGNSTPVRCFDTAAADRFTALDASPDTPEEREALIIGAREFGQSCWEASGTLLNHISTIETVRDLDLLRQVLGDDTLTYLGYSYGTQIGATYAELFPAKVGRMVLDAAVDITDDDQVIQAMGFDLALGNFATWCAAQSQCTLGDSKDAVISAITGLWDGLDARPISVGGRQLTQSLAATGVAMFLYSGEEAWQTLGQSIAAAISGDGRALLFGADQLNARGENGYDTMFFAFPAIGCLDSTDDGVLAADQQWTTDQQKAPIFAKYFGPGYNCALWPTRPALQLDIRGAGAAPIVVIGGTGDNATPYQQAVAMAERLASGVLVTYDGEGHGSYGGKSQCIDTLVVDFLADGKVPKDQTRCS